MRSRFALHSLIKNVMCDLERNDVHNFVRFHLVDQYGKHISGCNLVSIDPAGLEFYFGICSSIIDIDENETLKVVGVDMI